MSKDNSPFSEAAYAKKRMMLVLLGLCWTPISFLYIVVFTLSQPGWVQAADLRDVRDSKYGNFYRVVFEFQDNVLFESPKIEGKGKFSVVFLDSSTTLPRLTLLNTGRTQFVKSYEFVQQESNLIANVQISFPYFILKTYVLFDPNRIIVDAYEVSSPSEKSEQKKSIDEKPLPEMSTAEEAIELVTGQPSESNTIYTTNKNIDSGFESDSRGKSGVILIEDIGSFQKQNQTQTLLQIGPASVEKSFTSNTAFNYLTGMPERYKASAIQIDTPINFAPKTLPILFSFSYNQEVPEITLVPNRWDSENNLALSKFNDQMYTSHLISMGLSYSPDDFIDTSVSSSYSLEENQVHSSEKVEYLSYEMSLSVWPKENISITPSVSYGENRFAYWDKEGIRVTSASLNMTFYQLLEVMDLSLSHYYSRTKDDHGSEDGRALTTSLEMNWDLENMFSRKVRLSFELGHENYEYIIYPEESYKSVYSSFLLNIPF